MASALRDDPDFTVWWLNPEVKSAYKNDADIRKKLEQYKMEIYAFHSNIGDAHGYTPKSLAEFGKTDYKRYSKWRKVGGRYLRIGRKSRNSYKFL